MKLTLPTPADEAAVMAFRREFAQCSEQPLGAGGLERYESYAQWLRQALGSRSEQTVHRDLSPCTTLLCRAGDELVGMVTIRHRLTAFQLAYIGHMDLCIRPSCRGRGLGTQLLALALAECGRLGITRALLTCSRFDAAARSAIERNGGVLENQTAYEGDIRCRYWIDIPLSAIRPLGVDEIKRELFAGFDRRQQVTYCRRRVGLAWRLVRDPFVDDWTEEQLLRQIQSLRAAVRGGGVVFGAFAHGALKGFAAVAAHPMGPGGVYRDLLSLHVSADWRGRGLGRQLFAAAAQWARENGAQKLYISAHSAQETQAFYAAMGCVDSPWYSPEHVALEPFDCQLEYQL